MLWPIPACADAYCSLGVIGDVAAGEVFPKARIAAERALALDSSLAEAHTSLAYVKFSYDWDWNGAEGGVQAGGSPSTPTMPLHTNGMANFCG